MLVSHEIKEPLEVGPEFARLEIEADAYGLDAASTPLLLPLKKGEPARIRKKTVTLVRRRAGNFFLSDATIKIILPKLTLLSMLSPY